MYIYEYNVMVYAASEFWDDASVYEVSMLLCTLQIWSCFVIWSYWYNCEIYTLYYVAFPLRKKNLKKENMNNLCM